MFKEYSIFAKIHWKPVICKQQAILCSTNAKIKRVCRDTPLSSAEAPSVGKRRGNGEKRETTGKLKNRRRAGDDGKDFSFPLPSVPRALSFPFSPAHPAGKTKETSTEERADTQ